MSSEVDKNGEGTETVGQKIDKLSASVDRRFDAVDERVATLSASVDERFATLSASVDARFDGVDVALVEQRQYTEFAFDRLSDEMRNEMRKGFNGVDSRFATF